MSEFYQQADATFIDYQMQEIPGIQGRWRKPLFLNDLTPGKYSVCIGAAQTFGRFCEHPYPNLLSQDLGIPVLNLGIAGAGSSNFYSVDILNLINQGAFCIVQVMSGRSAPNYYFNSFTGKNAFGLDQGNLGPAAFAEQCIQYCIQNKDRNFINNFVLEIRRAWLDQLSLLAKKIKVPKILFWFSDRQPSYTLGTKNVKDLGSSYPQFIDEKTLHQAIPYFDYYVECVSNLGRPHYLLSDGKIVELNMGHNRLTKENKYYPTPEMHIAAKKKILPTCLEIIQPKTNTEKKHIKCLIDIYQNNKNIDNIKPNFLIVGAAKSGTSAISVQLNTHPKLFIPPQKELHFFDRLHSDSSIAQTQWSQYLSYFSGTQDFSARGEATVAYSMCTYLDSDIPKLIYKYLGLVKIIYIVRHPFDRIISQWRHLKRDNFEAPNLEEVLADDSQKGLWLDRSNYWLQIQPYIKVFGENNIAIELYEDYVHDFNGTLNRLWNFLDCDPKYIPPIQNVVINKTSNNKIPMPNYSESLRSDVMNKIKPDLDCFFNWLGRENLYQ